MSDTFKDKVVLITGAGSGIGRVAAIAFAKQGARVIVSDVAVDPGEETVRLVNKEAGEAHFLRADVTSTADVKTLITEIERAYGRLDFALNNAGIDGPRARTAEYPEDAWDQVLQVNLKGVFLCMKYELPFMLKQGSGVIINISSVAGVTGFVGHCGYTASKHGVIGLTKTAALEYARSGIRINAICPCYTRTPMVERMVKAEPGLEARLLGRIPMGRLGTPQEVAAAALYLCSDAGAFITGTSLVLDGGIMAE